MSLLAWSSWSSSFFYTLGINVKCVVNARVAVQLNQFLGKSDMKPYLLFFAAVYSIALVLLITVLIFGLKLGGITLLPALIAAAFISAGHFVKKEQRLPSSDEKIQLVWGSSAVAIIIGSFFVFFLVLMNPNAEEILKAADKAGLALAAVIMLCLIAIHGAVFHVAYGWYANRYYHKKFL